MAKSKSGRRANGEGTNIRLNEQQNRWEAKITVDGKRRTITGKTREDVRLKMTAMARDRDRGLPVAEGALTVKQYLGDWLSNKKATVEAGTWLRYEQLSRAYIIPALGRHKLAKLSPHQVQSFYAKTLQESGLSPTTVKQIHATLHASLNDAVRHDLAPRNVSALVQKPQKAKAEMLTYDAAQVEQLKAAMQGDPHEGVYLLLLNSGMRLGELIALHWRDVDLTCGTAALQRGWQRRGTSAFSEGKQKTEDSRRTIRLTPTAVELLRAQHKRQIERRLAAGPMWQEHDLLFSREDGTHLSHSMLEHHWPHVVKRAGLPYIRPHDLRHTFATLLLRNGAGVKVVSEMLGHSSVRITLEIYAHVQPDMQADAVAMLETIIGNQTSKKKEAQ
jgi:integrase